MISGERLNQAIREEGRRLGFTPRSDSADPGRFETRGDERTDSAPPEQDAAEQARTRMIDRLNKRPATKKIEGGKTKTDADDGRAEPDADAARARQLARLRGGAA